MVGEASMAIESHPQYKTLPCSTYSTTGTTTTTRGFLLYTTIFSFADPTKWGKFVNTSFTHGFFKQRVFKILKNHFLSYFLKRRTQIHNIELSGTDPYQESTGKNRGQEKGRKAEPEADIELLGLRNFFKRKNVEPNQLPIAEHFFVLTAVYVYCQVAVPMVAAARCILTAVYVSCQTAVPMVAAAY